MEVRRKGTERACRFRSKSSVLANSIVRTAPSRRIEGVAGSYRLNGKVAGFQLANYDRGRALIIDPTLTFSTYLGGSQTENQGQMAMDPAGNFYVTGNTFSTDFPVSKAAAQTAFASGPDAFVSKFNRPVQWCIQPTWAGAPRTSH